MNTTRQKLATFLAVGSALMADTNYHHTAIHGELPGTPGKAKRKKKRKAQKIARRKNRS